MVKQEASSYTEVNMDRFDSLDALVAESKKVPHVNQIWNLRKS